MTTTRRDFLLTMGAFAALPLARTEPDVILYNGNFWTVNPKNPRAEAVAISNGRFIAVGSNDDVLHLGSALSRKVDLGHKNVLPGFIDAHTHPSESGRLHLRQVDCDLRSISAIQSALRERAAKTPAEQWVLGFKYDDTKTAEQRRLTLQDLDAAVSDHPVLVTHRGGHEAFANSLAFKLAKVDEKTADPDGGQFEHDSAGHLTGRINERAMDAFNKVVPNTYSRDDYREGVKIISKMMTKTGITSVGDALGTPEDLQAYQDARDSGDLGMRVYCFIGWFALDRMLSAGIRTGFGDEWVRVGGMKQVADGAISGRTARLSQPYIGHPDDYGTFSATEEELYEYGRKAHAAGWQLGIHANGDVAIERVLNVYERINREMPRKDPRFRIEHCTLINDSIVNRMRALNVIPTPFSTYVYYHGEKMQYYGEERLKHMFALRTFLDAGLRPTQASDYPPGEFPPMMALQSEVTRTDMGGHVWGANQRVSVEEAIRIGTINGAYASYEESLKGTIEPGKLADLVVLGRDPMREDPSNLVNIPVERTMTGGKWVYES
ncbi:MAG TPA: amidohydrolase [Terriglobales bacterium]|nr:amidohydrolase [Terriglobales bacterium]